VKIVHLVIGGHVAGGQLVALRLARAARRAGHDAEFVSPTPGPFLERVAADGFAAHVLPIRGGLDARAVLRLRALLRRAGAEVLHTHGHFGINVVGRAAGRLAGARVIAHMHIENVFRDGRGGSVQVALDNLTARLCRWIVAVSDATRESLVRQGYPAARTVTIRNGIEPAERAAPVRLTEAPELLHVGRLAAVKGQRELIEALRELGRDDVHAVLLGRDLERGGDYARELRLAAGPNVHFAGFHANAASALREADALVLPSWIEGLPLVVLEAMAHAKPVVATSVGGTPEAVIDGETGLLVPPRDVPALQTALTRLLDDAELRRSLGEAGRDRVEKHFQATAMTGRILEIYGEL
jgi:glycosyltransferase involved in cell wall biosynthesis